MAILPQQVQDLVVSVDIEEENELKPSLNIAFKLKRWLRAIWADKGTRNLLAFLVLNLSFAFVELVYGMWTNSLGLISDSFHMFFDCTALLAGLIAAVVSRWPPNDKFSYGFARAEVVAGFVNALFLIFIAFFIFSEAIERAFEPPEIKHERLMLVSVAGFLVNLVGIFAFQHGGHGHSHGHSHDHSHGISQLPSHSGDNCSHASPHDLGNRSQDHCEHHHDHDHGHDGHDHHDHDHDHHNHHGQHDHDQDHSHDHDHAHDGHGHSHDHGHGHSHDHDRHRSGHTEVYHSSDSQIMHGIFLHILADTLGSVGVIISSFIIHMFGWMLADPICSMFIAALIMLSVYPLVTTSLGILMQRSPALLDYTLPGILQKVSEQEGVLEVNDPHFWVLCSGTYVGTLRLEVLPGTDCKRLLKITRSMLNQAGIQRTIIEINTID